MENKIEKNVYIQLYDIVSDNMKSAGKEMNIKRDVLMSTIDNGCFETDLMILDKVANESFLESAFEVILRRLPEKSMVENCYKNEITDEKQWRSNIVNNIINSVEYKTRAVPVKNNIYANEEKRNNPSLKSRIINKVYPHYKRLPRWMRVFIRFFAFKLKIINGD